MGDPETWSTELNDLSDLNSPNPYTTLYKRYERKVSVGECSMTAEAGKYQFVYFDIETTGFGANAEICQIAAKHKERIFSEYILPVRDLSPYASMINGLKLSDGVLYKDNLPVKVLTLNQCLVDFLEFLKGVGNSVILVGHNILTFDCCFLVRDMNHCHLNDQFFLTIKGLLDTLPLMKSVIPGRETYKLLQLAQDYLHEEECLGAHDALCDVEMLEGIVGKLNIGSDILCKHLITLEMYIDKKKRKKNKLDNVLTLEPCVGILSTVIINKLATCGLNLPILLDKYKACGEEGIKALLSEDVDGRPKVTKNKKIILSLLTFLSDYKS